MNQELLKLKRLRDKVIGIEMQLALIDTDLLAVERDIEYLDNLLALLIENLEVLKSDGIIVVASEYKKVKEELATVMKNLRIYNDLHGKLLKDFDRYRKMYSQAFEEYEESKKDIDSRKVILLFDPAKRKK